MCNAWNHPEECKCGWGGDGHTGYRVNALPDPVYFFNQSLASFVNPNASCPVCKAPVFYYENSHGGKVFFDELGPPWPKHYCTEDNTPSRSTRNKKTAWSPFLHPTVGGKVIRKGFASIEGSYKGKWYKLYYKTTKHGLLGPLKSGCAYMCIPKLGSFRISFIDGDSGEIIQISALNQIR
ncbi:hypothetical protein GCM10017044_03140 [Kordiimonas sediminis]|uniref:Uncharacterized protein n=1 Tax=Kordiimonas sediminis TaxID=1735581 RepID=A0A919AKZ6_9PROT|nr:hypothetical protein GCM10017044_03140 [Kordiimonas sediminis]